jgi:hypothetical protein
MIAGADAPVKFGKSQSVVCRLVIVLLVPHEIVSWPVVVRMVLRVGICREGLDDVVGFFDTSLSEESE